MLRNFIGFFLLVISFNSYAQVIANNKPIGSSLEPKMETFQQVDASDGTSIERVKIKWEYAPPQSGTFSIYRSTNAEEPGVPIMANHKLSRLLDYKATPGVLYYYTVFFKSPAKRIVTLGKDSGYKKVSEFVSEEQIGMVDVLDSGNGKFRLDSLTIKPKNPAIGDEILLDYSLSNNNAFPISQVQLKFWLSEDTTIDSSDKLLLTKRFEAFAPSDSIQEILQTTLFSSIEAGNYYIIGELVMEENSMQTVVQNITIE